MKRNMLLWVAMALVSSAALLGSTALSLPAQQGEAIVNAKSQPQSPSAAVNAANLTQEQTARETLNASGAAVAASAEPQKAETARAEARSGEDEAVVKTYTVKYIDYHEVLDAARVYLMNSSGSGDTFTILIRKKYIPDFEAVLKKLDVEKKNIMFRVYTIIAARDVAQDILKKPETKDIDNRDLRAALDEMKGLWNFKHYWVDAPSFMTVKDGSGGSNLKLVSGLLDYADFTMALRHVFVSGDELGKRTITMGEIKLDLNVNAPNAQKISTLIDTQDISLKEKGYLIVGVSGLETGWSGLALILVISAEIK
jgi:hypothetical protein